MTRVEFAEDALRDLALIYDHLAETYQAFGETSAEVAEHAAARLRGILAAADRLALAPHRGPLHADIAPGLRHVTLDRAVYYFQLVAPDRVRVLAVFLGGQDHERHMRLRILRRE
jgi:plasmid stabilization system protein ParE